MVITVVETVLVGLVRIVNVVMIQLMLTLQLNAVDMVAGLKNVANVLHQMKVVETHMPNSTTLILPLMMLVSGK